MTEFDNSSIPFASCTYFLITIVFAHLTSILGGRKAKNRNCSRYVAELFSSRSERKKTAAERCRLKTWILHKGPFSFSNILEISLYTLCVSLFFLQKVWKLSGMVGMEWDILSGMTCVCTPKSNYPEILISLNLSLIPCCPNSALTASTFSFFVLGYILLFLVQKAAYDNYSTVVGI